MKLQLISVFIENSPGRLYQVTQALCEAGINLRSVSLGDIGDFGVLRLLVSNVARARQIIMKKNLPARMDEVVAIEIADYPGSLAQVLKPLLDANINITYMYSHIGFSSGKAIVVFRFNDNDRAIEVLKEKGIQLLDEEAFNTLEMTTESPKSPL